MGVVMRAVLVLLCAGTQGCYQADFSADGGAVVCSNDEGCGEGRRCLRGVCLKSSAGADGGVVEDVGVSAPIEEAGPTVNDVGSNIDDVGSSPQDAGAPINDLGSPANDAGTPQPTTLNDCENAYVRNFDGRTYHLCGDGVNFQDAKASCRAAGMNLVKVTGERLNSWLVDQALSVQFQNTSQSVRYWWIGAEYRLGNWMWPDGSVVGDYRPWVTEAQVPAEARPDRGFVHLMAGRGDAFDGKWWASRPSVPVGYVCDGGVSAGQSQDHPSQSCATLHQDQPNLSSGHYWIDPDGQGSSPSFSSIL